MDAALAIAIIAAAGLVAAAILLRRGGTPASGAQDNLSAAFAPVTQALQDVRAQSSAVAANMGALGERLSNVELQQATLQTSVQDVYKQLAATTTLTDTVRQAAETIRNDLGQARENLGKLQNEAEARRDLEARTAQSVQRLELIIAGTGSRGAAGEHLVERVFSQLPPEWQIRDYTIGGATVEFALSLPNGRIVPIDSKWPAAEKLQQFAESKDEAERTRLHKDIRDATLKKAKEVQKYLDPEKTHSYGIAVVPDAVFDLCTDIQGECLKANVILLGHSMLVPYLVLTFDMVLRSSQDVDIERLAAQIKLIDEQLGQIHDLVEGTLSRGITQITNARNNLRVATARSVSAVNSVRSYTAPGSAPLELTAPSDVE